MSKRTVSTFNQGRGRTLLTSVVLCRFEPLALALLKAFKTCRSFSVHEVLSMDSGLYAILVRISMSSVSFPMANAASMSGTSCVIKDTRSGDIWRARSARR